jgi:uncharacterized protein with NRDE domain
VCLLIVASRTDEAFPLVVGANRDERLDRPAVSAAVLRESGPRILGGRDRLGGGTWLAVNEHGVVAALTNRPAPGGRDPSKRTRGELPVALATHSSASAAVQSFVESFSPADFNPCWILVGDRKSVFAIDMSAGSSPVATALGEGVHILENLPFGSESVKVDHVRSLLGVPPAGRGSDAHIDALRFATTLRTVLRDHTVAGDVAGGRGFEADVDERPDEQRGQRGERGEEGQEAPRRPETLAACVHSEDYGTRCSTVVVVSSEPGAKPVVEVADGHPCESPFEDVSWMWGPADGGLRPQAP